MRGRICIYKWLLAIWLICMGGAISPAVAYTQAALPSAWRSTPALSTDVQPNYQFRSTSTITPIVGQTSYTAGSSDLKIGQYRPGSIRRGIDDEEDDPTGDPIGLIDTPVGEIPLLMMLVMACLYAILTKKRKKVQKNLVVSEKSTTFARFFERKGINPAKW